MWDVYWMRRYDSESTIFELEFSRGGGERNREVVPCPSQPFLGLGPQVLRCRRLFVSKMVFVFFGLQVAD